MAEIITLTGTVLTGILSWCGSIVTFIVGQPLLMIPVVFGFIGMSIGVIKRFA